VDALTPTRVLFAPPIKRALRDDVYDALMQELRELEAEGVGVKTVKTPPPPPVKVAPVREKLGYDIAIPLTRPVYFHNVRRLAELDPLHAYTVRLIYRLALEGDVTSGSMGVKNITG